MKKRRKLTQEESHEWFDYNKISGDLVWRKSPSTKIKVGNIAGYLLRSSNKKTSYRLVQFRGDIYLVHRLIFFYMTGRWPHDQIDHIDGNGLNNSWVNIREGSTSQNRANCRVQKNNKLGVKGVHQLRGGKYQAQIKKNGKKMSLGRYDILEDAALAYQRAAKKYHGEFARW